MVEPSINWGSSDFLSLLGTGGAGTLRYMYYEQEINCCHGRPLMSGLFCYCSITGSFFLMKGCGFCRTTEVIFLVTKLHTSFGFTHQQPTIWFITIPRPERKDQREITECVLHCKHCTRCFNKLFLFGLPGKGRLDVDISSFVTQKGKGSTEKNKQLAPGYTVAFLKFHIFGSKNLSFLLCITSPSCKGKLCRYLRTQGTDIRPA